jgi:16S rRNA (uracil1498-N3)-methyltransferase
MHRFFSSNADLRKEFASITDLKEIHHLQHVLRLKKGDTLCVFNGKREEAVGTIFSLNKRKVDIKIDFLTESRFPAKTVSSILACAIPKKAKFEFIIEKCTELGIDEIIPLKTQRTEVRFEGEAARRKSARYQTVAMNAAKQSNRLSLPVIHPVSAFPDVIKMIDRDCAAFIPCLFGERKPLAGALKLAENQKRIIFFIGPEGDFTPQEVASAINAGCIPVSLGPTVLKVDTAAISVAAFLNLSQIPNV